jgi:hypothetical protein
MLPAESVEGRELTEENAKHSLLDRTQRRTTPRVVPPRVARAAGRTRSGIA